MDNAGGRRIPRGGSLQESKCQVWPAAIRPQTPAVPGTKRPPDFGRRSGARRVTKCDHGRHPPRASRARPERDTPNTVWRAAAGEAPADAERSCSRRSPPVLVPGLRRLTHQNQKGDLSSREDCRGERV